MPDTAAVSIAKQASTTAQNSQPWWREPMMWLVLGGPAVVVVAAITTGVIAYVGADEVLKDPILAKPVVQPTGATPAMNARNHAATAVER
jgi:hypothetical protein